MANIQIMKTTLANIGRYALLIALAFGLALLIGYCAVIGQVWMSIVTIGGIGYFLGVTKTVKGRR